MRYVKKMMFFVVLISVFVLAFGSIYAAAEQKDAEVYYKYYTSIQIEEDDTLWYIAERYGNEACQSRREYIQEVKRMNHLTDDTIHAGNYLMVAYYSQEMK